MVRMVRPYALLIMGLVLLVGCKAKKEEKSLAPPPVPIVPVMTAPVASKTMPVTIRAIGHVEPMASVQVRARVNGELIRVHFIEGALVERGQRLFSIDPRPYEAILRQAEAKLLKDQALLSKAEADVQRYAGLVEKDYVTREQYDQIQASASSLKADVASDQAVIENARLQVEYCAIVSPISGRTGDLQVKLGNMVGANSEIPLVVVNQIQPIEVAFPLPAQTLSEVSRRFKETLKVRASFPEKSETAMEGVLSFVDNAMDAKTNTVLLKATFPNEDEALWPGQYVDVVLILVEEPDRIVVPSTAVQTGQQGQYVYVVKEDKTVDLRPVKVNRIDASEAVLDEGVVPGEVVVTDGQLRLIPGSKVEEKTGLDVQTENPS